MRESPKEKTQINGDIAGIQGPVQGCWRWPESRWVNPDLDWRSGDLIVAGIDVGSVSSQAVVLVDGVIYAYGNVRTGYDSPMSAKKALGYSLEGTGLEASQIAYCVGTGYGRVNVPMANRTLTEIACHARGANFIYGPEVRTILDVGGQDIKAIQCDEKGKVVNFILNDKCAAGTGRGMEVFAELLGIPVWEVGERSLDVEEEPMPVSNVCVVYAKSEAISLLKKGWSVERVIAAYCRSMAERIYGLLEKLGIVPLLGLTGGVAKNPGIVKRLEALVGLKVPTPSWDTQLAGAIGAALYAHELALRVRKR